MRPAFASTSDPSGSRRATNRVTARDPRPKSPGSLPLSFLPSFLTLFRRAFSATSLPSSLISLSIGYSIPALYSSSLFFHPRRSYWFLFFTRLASITDPSPPRVLGFQAVSAGQVRETRGERAECENRRKRELPPEHSTALTLFSVRDRE